MNLEVSWCLYTFDYPSEWSEPHFEVIMTMHSFIRETSELRLCKALNPTLNVSEAEHEENLW